MTAPLNRTEQEHLTRAFHLRDLREVPPALQQRIADLLRMLRASPEPANLLRQWFPSGPRFLDQHIRPSNPRIAANHGHLLVVFAWKGAENKVAERLSRRHVEYLRNPHNLAEKVRGERLVQGITPEELAIHAGVSSREVRALEGEEELTSLPSVRRILRTLDIEASALPPMPVPQER